jgi:hypothetical protein
MVIVLVTSVVHVGSSHGRVKPEIIKSLFVASPLTALRG